MNDSIPDLKIELMEDGIGDGLILLTQDGNGNGDYRVAIHPMHLRLMAEKFGLIETRDPQAQKTIAMLMRRLHLLRKRVDHLAHWLATNSDIKNADLSYEQVYAIATADIAEEFCAELPASCTHSAGSVQATNSPEGVHKDCHEQDSLFGEVPAQ